MSAHNSLKANAGTTDERTLEARMPESIKQDFMDSMGRTFECPECGAPTSGTCGECGHTHAQMREDDQR